MQALRNFKTYFFRGLATLLPTILTVWMFVQLYLFIQRNVIANINRVVMVYNTPYCPYLSQDDLSSYIKNNFAAAYAPRLSSRIPERMNPCN